MARTPDLQRRISTIELWIRRTLAMDPPRAKSLVVSIFGDAIAPRGGAIRLKNLIELLGPFDVNERSVRTSVFRLVKEDWLETTRNGRESSYRLTRTGFRRLEHAYEKVYRRPAAAWDGTWTFILIPNEHLTVPRRLKVKQELEWEGVRQLTPQLFAHPTVRVEALSEIFDRSEVRGKVISFSGATTDQLGMCVIRELVNGTWNLRQVAGAYKRFERDFAKLKSVLARGERLSGWEWLAIRVLLIHSFRRIVLHDPLLPNELLPNPWIGDDAYRLAGEIYRISLPESERYLCEGLGPATEEAVRTMGRRFNTA
ncbi:MAG: PaaX family transcriptional regulator C-terminal domain-containing protein, partial [Chthoniobacterales bacterium]